MKKFKPSNVKNPKLMGLWVGMFAIIGVGTLLLTHAATPSQNLTGAGGGQSNTCVYSTPGTVSAFCESFDTPYNGVKTQTGDLNPDLWGVSRNTQNTSPSAGHNVSLAISHNACEPNGGGTTGNPLTGDARSVIFGNPTPPPADSRICNGLFIESNNDGGQYSAIDSYPKQPFKFTGRTGTVVFDVSSDDTGSHGAWPEFLITDEPVPGNHRCITTCPKIQHARNEIGFSLDGNDFTRGVTGVGSVYYSKDGIFSEQDSIQNDNTITQGCLAKGSYNCPTTKMNHFEVKVSVNRIDIYGTDAYSGTLNLNATPLKHLVGKDIPGGLNFSQGLVWIDDVHYNAHKAVEPNQTGTQNDHSFAWDNLGFDGEKTYRDLGYDVPLNTEAGPNSDNGDKTVNIGYVMNTAKTWSLPDVTWQQTPTRAKVVLNVYTMKNDGTITASLNGHTAVTRKISDYSGGYDAGFYSWSMAVDLPASDAVKGPNSLTISSNDPSALLYNTSLILVAAAPVPGTTTPPPPTTFAPGDYDQSGVVDVFDLSRLLSQFNKTVTPGAIPDLDNNGIINVIDLSKLLANWTK